MRRRDFIGTSVGAAVSLIGTVGCQPKEKLSACGNRTYHRSKAETPDKTKQYVTDNDKLAGFGLKGLRDRYRYDLFDDFLPFMKKYVIDHELGGFMCNTDRDGTNLSTKKNSWYIGRGIWVYSFLHDQLAPRKQYLKVANKAVRFILQNPPSGNNFWPVEYTQQGKPMPTNNQEIYGDLFIANGLAEYGRATGDDKYWYMAKDIMSKCVRIYDRPDYAPDAPKVYIDYDPTNILLRGGQASSLPGTRTLGASMVLLRLCTQMLNHKKDSDIEAVAHRCVDAVLNHHYNPDYDLLNEVLNHDMSRPDNEYKDLVYTGHVIEMMWMMIDEACRLRDRKLFDKTARLLRRHLEIAWDDVYGGLFRCLKNVDENTWILDKAVWVQEEAIIGLLYIIEHTGEQWAKDWFSRIFTYVHDKFPLKKHGYSLWDHWPDRKATFVKHYSRVENFHHPRHLMLSLLCIERMIQQRGKVSGIFT